MNKRLVKKTIDLLRVINETEGSEKAIEVFQKLGDIIGNEELKLEVLKTLLGGGLVHNENVVISKWTNTGDNKVSAIKALRQLTHCELKEAKEAVESAETARTIVPIAVHLAEQEDWYSIQLPTYLSQARCVGLSVCVE